MGLALQRLSHDYEIYDSFSHLKLISYKVQDETAVCKITYIDNLSIFAAKQFAEWWYDTAVDEGGNLFLGPADAEVGDCPGCFLLRLELTLREVLYDLRQKARIYDCLHLLLVAGCDV